MWGAIAGAAVGGLAGSQGSSSTQTSVSGIRVAPETALEKQATGTLESSLKGYEGIVNAGPGEQAQKDYMSASGNLQSMLKSYASGGFMPTQQDWTTAGDYASQVFKPQQVMQQQQFAQQQQQAQRLAAQLNRPVNDPIIQAKLAQEQMRQSDVLGAQQSSYGAQFAQQLPMQRLGFTQQLADVSGNLASQAMSNRQALMSLGSTLREQDRSYRIATGEHYGTNTQTSGGGLAGALNGAMMGAGAGLGVQGTMQGMANNQQAFGAFMNQTGPFKPQQAVQQAAQSFAPQMSQLAPQSPYAGQQTSVGVPSFLNPATAYSSPLQAAQQQNPMSFGTYNPFLKQFGGYK